jgi:hypothetical protein
MKTLFFTGRNSDNQSGVSWKDWKIQRKGRFVETRWGPIKIVRRRIIFSRMLASKRWPAFATVKEAKNFYDRKVREKLRTGADPRGSG